MLASNAAPAPPSDDPDAVVMSVGERPQDTVVGVAVLHDEQQGSVTDHLAGELDGRPAGPEQRQGKSARAEQARTQQPIENLLVPEDVQAAFPKRHDQLVAVPV